MPGLPASSAGSASSRLSASTAHTSADAGRCCGGGEGGAAGEGATGVDAAPGGAAADADSALDGVGRIGGHAVGGHVACTIGGGGNGDAEEAVAALVEEAEGLAADAGVEDDAGLRAAAGGLGCAASDTEDVAALYVDAVAFGRIEWILRCSGTDGHRVATLQVEVFVGVDGIVVQALGVDVAVLDVEVPCGVDGIVVAVGGSAAAGDVHIGFALDALGAVARSTESHSNIAAADGQQAVGLNALGRAGGVAAAYSLPGRGNFDGASADGQLAVGLDALAASACALCEEVTSADGDVAVGLQCAARGVVGLCRIVNCCAGSHHDLLAAGDEDVGVGLDTFLGVAARIDVQKTAAEADAAFAVDAITVGGGDADVATADDHAVVGVDAVFGLALEG